MLGCGCLDLGGGGEMDEAVAAVVIGAIKDAIGLSLPPQCRGHDFVDHRHRALGILSHRVGCKLHILATAALRPITTALRHRRRSTSPAKSSSKLCIGAHPVPPKRCTAPPAARTKTMPPATSQIFGAAKCATSSKPAATSAHSTAAEPVLRKSQNSSSGPLCGRPASLRRTAGLTVGVVFSPSKRRGPFADAW